MAVMIFDHNQTICKLNIGNKFIPHFKEVYETLKIVSNLEV